MCVCSVSVGMQVGFSFSVDLLTFFFAILYSLRLSKVHFIAVLSMKQRFLSGKRYFTIPDIYKQVGSELVFKKY